MIQKHGLFSPHQKQLASTGAQQSQLLRPCPVQKHGCWKKDQPRAFKLLFQTVHCSVASRGQHRDDRECQNTSALRLVAARNLQQTLTLLKSSATGLALAAVMLTESVGGTAYAKPRLTQDEQLTVDLFKRNTPSVVFITNLAVRCALHIQLPIHACSPA